MEGDHAEEDNGPSTKRFYIETRKFGKICFDLPLNLLPKKGKKIQLLKLLLTNYQAYFNPSISYTSMGLNHDSTVTYPPGVPHNEDDFLAQAENPSNILFALNANQPTPNYTTSINQQAMSQLGIIYEIDTEFFLEHTDHGLFICSDGEYKLYLLE